MRSLRIRQVLQVTGLSRMTIYRLETAGRFPRRRQLSGNSVAWLESEIVTWAKARPVAQLCESPQNSLISPAPGNGRSQRRHDWSDSSAEPQPHDAVGFKVIEDGW